MARYLSLLTYTDQGIKNIKESPQRAKKFRSALEQAGGKILAQYWAVGQYDGCIAFEVPDEVTATRLLLELGQDGNVRTHSMRLLDETEFGKAIS